ncbi:MAG: hypothetical protein ACM3OO_06530 [Planctomycetaceae bacterium]
MGRQATLRLERSPRFYVVEEYDEPGFPPMQIVAEYLGLRDADATVWLPFLGEEAVSREDLLQTPAGRAALARWERHDDDAYSTFHRLAPEHGW